MTISTEFNAEIALVDGARSFTYDSGYSDYGENEWSVSGWTVRGGSDAACEHGAYSAMYAMDFRYYTPVHTVRPVSLPSGGVTLARQEFVMPYVGMFYNYGYALWADDKTDDFNKWAELNCARDGRRPAGHAWPSIISGIEATDGFFTANPTYMTGVIGHAGASFNLNLTGADYDALVDRVAAYVAITLNEYNFRNFDPQDGAPQTTDEVCAFANAVILKVRETVPNAMLGIYAYAGHRLPPTIDCPHLFTLVAMQYNDTPLTYIELVTQWGARVAEVGLRGYGLIASNKDIDPFRNGICNDDAFQTSIRPYATFIAAGTKALAMESTGHHIAGLVGHYSLMQYVKDGSTTHADVRDDMLANLPDFTAETHALFEHWGTNRENRVSVSTSYDLIDALPDNPLSTQIKRYWTWYRHMKDVVNTRLAVAKDGSYYSALELNLRMAKALQDDNTAHGYAHARQEANTNVALRMDLHHDNDAHWTRFPAYPTDELYDELKSEWQSGLQRPSELDDTTLALCSVTPLITPPQGPATEFSTSGGTPEYCFIGPGTVTTDDGATVYGAGLHRFNAAGSVTFSGGILFVDSFPNIDIDDGTVTGDHWLYIPKLVRGRPLLNSTIRLSMRDANATFDIGPHVPPFGGNDDPRDLQAGQCRFSWAGIRGVVENINCNPWISPQYDRALVPRALAVREGLTILETY